LHRPVEIAANSGHSHGDSLRSEVFPDAEQKRRYIGAV
jgi:hypothetical protein